MSSEQSDKPDFVSPADVLAERNWLRQFENIIGVNGEDFEGDDSWQAAMVYNLARMGAIEQRQAELLSLLTGQPVEVEAPLQVSVVDPLQIQPPDVNPQIDVTVDEITPQVSFPDDVAVQIEGIQIDEDEIAAAMRQAVQSEHLIQVYSVPTSAADDNILTQPVRPQTQHSSFRVTVTLDSNVGISLHVNPDDNDAFTTDLNQGGTLKANSKREFQFDVDPGAEYNFRTGGPATVQELRVQEVFTE